MTVRYLSSKEAAARVGIAPGTWQSYIAKGLTPPPDALIGESTGSARGWLPETIDRWQANRPGRGARTDLH
ncbi:MAG: transcriptional regulator [Actinomyces sp.]|nr:transcriptional regulator [Actinomyces sp.]MDU2984344.1 transcriptional regulator [Actinomyces sp.]